MTGSITAEILAAGPEIWDVIDQAGQTVTIHRPGLPDATARAVLYQEDNKGEGSVADPQFKVLGWQGIFKPDAPLTLPYTITDYRGRQFVPDGATQDPAEQGVAQIVHLLPLPDRTRISNLTFAVSGPLVKDPTTGNSVPSKLPPVQVAARLVASSDPRIRDMAGANDAEVVLIGRWGTLEAPQVRPPAVRWGSTSPLVVDGQNGTLTVKVAYPDPDVLQEVQLGGRFVATWKSNP